MEHKYSLTSFQDPRSSGALLNRICFPFRQHLAARRPGRRGSCRSPGAVLCQVHHVEKEGFAFFWKESLCFWSYRGKQRCMPLSAFLSPSLSGSFFPWSYPCPGVKNDFVSANLKPFLSQWWISASIDFSEGDYSCVCQKCLSFTNLINN